MKGVRLDGSYGFSWAIGDRVDSNYAEAMRSNYRLLMSTSAGLLTL